MLQGKPEEVLPRVFQVWRQRTVGGAQEGLQLPTLHPQDWKVKLLTFESDTEPYAKRRDAAIKTLAAEVGGSEGWVRDRR